MPNTVRAAAEGMPNTTRRTALAVTGSGLIAALGGLALSTRQASSAPALSPDMSAAVADYRAKVAAYLQALKTIADAENAPDAPPLPTWSPMNASDAWAVGHNVRLHSVKSAEDFFEKMLTAHARYQPEDSTYLRHVRAVREQAIASLSEQEVAFAPMEALEEICSDAGTAACDAYKALLAAPCRSLADVQAKAHALLTDGAAACHTDGIDQDEFATVLQSCLATGEA